jgi:signal transduction histidine kinase
VLQDTLGNELVKQKVAEAVFRNTLKQKETENTLLLKDNELHVKTIYNQRVLIGAVALILLLLLLLLFIIIRNSRSQKAMNLILDHKNKELEELNITKDKFISIIAHDLKSPFNGLLGLLTELDEHYNDFDENTRHSIINRLKKSSYNTFNLLVNLLDWSKSQQGQMKSNPTVIDLEVIVSEVFTLLATRASMKNQQLTANIGVTPGFHADPQIIKAILINLVNNAIKFTPTGGRITVNATKADKEVLIEVEDTGIGIPEREIPNLFRIDCQYKRNGTDNEPGTGLGLVMCREYVTLLGGTVGVKSREGTGSRFLVRLPGKSD